VLRFFRKRRATWWVFQRGFTVQPRPLLSAGFFFADADPREPNAVTYRPLDDFTRSPVRLA